MSMQRDYILTLISEDTLKYCIDCGRDETWLADWLGKHADSYSAEELEQIVRDTATQSKVSDVRAKLDCNDKGKVYCTIDNMVKILEFDSKFAGLELNTLTGCPERAGKVWLEADSAEARRYIEHEYGIRSNIVFQDALLIHARTHAFSPIIREIERTVWDGVPRVSEFLVKWLKAEDNAYIRECSRLLFAGGIARAYKPGSKVDNVIVFIGDQGCGKSTLCSWLAMDDKLYTSAHDEIIGKTGPEMLQGKWIIELAELISVTRPDDQERVKEFIDRRVEHCRRPYEAAPADYPRTCTFIGTTNKQAFLMDKTGNRRWFPVRSGLANDGWLYAHEAEIKADIRQCWAEMAHAYDAKEPFADAYGSHDTEIVRLAEAARELVMETDDDEAKIIYYLRTNPEVTKVTLDFVWRDILEHDRPQQRSKRESNHIGSILSDSCKWRKGRCEKVGRYTGKTWYRPDPDVITCPQN